MGQTVSTSPGQQHMLQDDNDCGKSHSSSVEQHHTKQVYIKEQNATLQTKMQKDHLEQGTQRHLHTSTGSQATVQIETQRDHLEQATVEGHLHTPKASQEYLGNGQHPLLEFETQQIQQGHLDIHTADPQEPQGSDEYVVLCPVGEQADHEVVWSPPPMTNEEEMFTATVEEEPGNRTNDVALAMWEARRCWEAYSQDVRGSSDILSLNRSISLSMYLQAREGDAAEVLLDLGFGQTDARLRIPDRFISTTSSDIYEGEPALTRSSISLEEVESPSPSLQSYPSTWSDLSSLYDRLPARFVPSVSRSNSLGDLTDTEDLDKTVLPVPVIVEPNEVADDAFDLMRHLRLNRGHQKNIRDGIFLEPLTEELEVSSVGSASERTKISAKQESLDSLGTVSVFTKISRKQDSTDTTIDNVILEQPESIAVPCDENSRTYEVPNERTREITGTPADTTKKQLSYTSPSSDRDNKLELANNGTPSSLGDSESGIGSGFGDQESLPGRVLPLTKSHLDALIARTMQESFELEEVATEENYDCCDPNRSGENATPRGDNRGPVTEEQLKRQYSDESSGFEEEVAVREKSRKIPGHVPEIHIISNDASPTDETIEVRYMDGISAMKEGFLSFAETKSVVESTDVKDRRSAFAKRRSWSATKQRRVAFEDDVRPKAHSFHGHVSQHDPSIGVNKHVLKLASPHADGISSKLKPAIAKDTYSAESSDVTKNLMPRTASERTAMTNIRTFFTRLWSSKHQKTVRDVTKTQGDGGSPMPLHANVSEAAKEPHTIARFPIKQTEKQHSRVEHGLTELAEVEEKIQKYHTIFFAMESISTIERSYYTNKLLARLAWDVAIVRGLRTLIKQQITETERHLQIRRKRLLEKSIAETLPVGLLDEIGSLLEKQARLRDQLMDLSSDVRDRWRDQNAVRQNVVNTKELELQIKNAVLEELRHTMFRQIDEFRQELRAKDAIIDELRSEVKIIQETREREPTVEHARSSSVLCERSQRSPPHTENLGKLWSL